MWARKALGEFAVIVVGVMVALIADRWLQARIDTEQSQAYLSFISTDLRRDSVALAARIEQAENRATVALLLLELTEGMALPDSVSIEETVAEFEMLAWFSPFDSNRDTWDDLVTTGNSLLINSDLRRLLSVHYNLLEGVTAMEMDWDQQLALIEVSFRDTQPALRRLEALELAIPIGLLGQRLERRGIEQADLDTIVRRLRQEPTLNAGVGHCRSMWLGMAAVYEGLLFATSQLLADIEARAS